MLFKKGRSMNLSKGLNGILMDRVKIVITDLDDDEVVFDTTGILYKIRICPKVYMYHLGYFNLDLLLQNLVGSNIGIEIAVVDR